MKLTELQPILERAPFRPFGLRLSNGAVYEFLEPGDLGLPARFIDTLFYFGAHVPEHRGWVLIDVEHITEAFNL